jgi:AraC family transcriptional regulator
MQAFNCRPAQSPYILHEEVMAEIQHIGGLSTAQETLVKELIESELGHQLKLSLLASACHLHVQPFSEAFKRSVGQTPYKYIVNRRLEWAKQLMTSSSVSLLEVAVTCGFGTHSNFTRRFLKATGETPGAWRKTRCGKI